MKKRVGKSGTYGHSENRKGNELSPSCGEKYLYSITKSKKCVRSDSGVRKGKKKNFPATGCHISKEKGASTKKILLVIIARGQNITRLKTTERWWRRFKSQLGLNEESEAQASMKQLGMGTKAL